jgi:hypothetical protein
VCSGYAADADRSTSPFSSTKTAFIPLVPTSIPSSLAIAQILQPKKKSRTTEPFLDEMSHTDND